MAQHINLLRKQPLLPPSLLWGGLAVALLVVAQTGYGAWLWHHNGQQEAVEQRGLDELAGLRAQLAKRGQRGADHTERLADTKRLTQEASVYGPLVALVQQGSLGLDTGYAQHLSLLARTADAQVWITQVTLANAGRSMSLQGQAVDEPAVLRFADRLNQAYRPLGLAFFSMDLSVAQTEASAPGAGAPQGSKTVSFRLN
jgi:hypothetical protein